jgi:RNA polymerase primary sigma factor
VAPDEIVQDMETIDYMSKLISRLEKREQDILALRFGLNGEKPRTLEEVSQIIGRTRERVRQIQNQALEKLRMMIEEEGIETTYTSPSVPVIPAADKN